ncbi:unnamed protein product [Arctogadus glacialis]
MPTNTAAFSPVIAAPSPVKNDVPIVQDAAGNTISIPTATGAKKRFWIIEDMSPYGKRSKTASSRKMLDEGMMLEGFRRYDLYENCKDPTCQFSLKVTHYHCTRENCGYKFCGRTHMYKHAQHHDRVDNLVLDDFKRFKSTLSCHVADCQFSGNSTHFHCLRCGFRCTDSTKVTAHRKHHGKQDVITAAGFCQFSSSVDCAVADCKYKLKCSHFHCTFPECRHTVVGMSQMDSHKRKHEKQERGGGGGGGELTASPGRQEAGRHHHHPHPHPLPHHPQHHPQHQPHHHQHPHPHHGGLGGGLGGMPHAATASSSSSSSAMAAAVAGMALSGPSPAGLHGLVHGSGGAGSPLMYPPVSMASEYGHAYPPPPPPPAVSLDGSLNLGADGAGSSLFFLQSAAAAGLGLADSLDLSQKMHRSSAIMAAAAAAAGSHHHHQPRPQHPHPQPLPLHHHHLLHGAEQQQPPQDGPARGASGHTEDDLSPIMFLPSFFY